MAYGGARICLLVLASCISSGSGAAESYLCIEDMTTGFSYNKARNQWTEASFKSGGKFLVTKWKGQGGYKWAVKEIGRDVPSAQCEEDFNDVGNLFCRGMDTFNMNKNTRRFIRSFLHGYWQDDNPGAGDNPFKMKEGENTPVISIGKCSSL
jgi:hypothetical protein